MLSEQPSWVPDWVWGSYQNGSYILNGADSLIASEACRVVWSAVERRVENPGRPVAARIFSSVEQALDFSGAAIMGKAERKRKADAMISAARTLREGLISTQAPLHHLYDFAETISTREAIDESGFIGNIDRGLLGIGISEADFLTGASVAVRNALCCHMDEVLAAIESDVAAWELDVVVQRPNKVNSARTYFIRCMTGAFIRLHSLPLREATLALASVFFDCENMTAADVANIAPVEKT